MVADIATFSRRYGVIAAAPALLAFSCDSFADEVSAGEEYMYSAGIAIYLAGFYAIQLFVTLAISAWKLFGEKGPGSAAAIFAASLASMAASLLAIWMLSQILPDSLFKLFVFAIAVLPPIFWYLSFKLRRR
ncbi:hypothetical protein [Lysobacter capsici]|uniref:hypothetical protein n=1 Tax=Lysobacter capsici TaxID=435897 RepID=UPI000627C017|nr:hypothetical protein [Lysobacter capsici]